MATNRTAGTSRRDGRAGTRDRRITRQPPPVPDPPHRTIPVRGSGDRLDTGTYTSRGRKPTSGSGPWVRSGFPDGLPAVNDDDGLAFRRNFIRTCPEHDVSERTGRRIPAGGRTDAIEAGSGSSSCRSMASGICAFAMPAKSGTLGRPRTGPLVSVPVARFQHRDTARVLGAGSAPGRTACVLGPSTLGPLSAISGFHRPRACAKHRAKQAAIRVMHSARPSADIRFECAGSRRRSCDGASPCRARLPNHHRPLQPPTRIRQARSRPPRAGPFHREHPVLRRFVALAITALGGFLLWEAFVNGTGLADAVLRLCPL